VTNWLRSRSSAPGRRPGCFPNTSSQLMSDTGPPTKTGTDGYRTSPVDRTVAESPLTWAEDRATQRCDPRADPRAKTDESGRVRPASRVRPSLPPHPDWHQIDKPSRHDAAIPSTGCRPTFTNSNHPQFQFTLNQDIVSSISDACTSRRPGCHSRTSSGGTRNIGRCGHGVCRRHGRKSS